MDFYSRTLRAYLKLEKDSGVIARVGLCLKADHLSELLIVVYHQSYLFNGIMNQAAFLKIGMRFVVAENYIG